MTVRDQSLAAQAGIDMSVCEFCEQPLDDSQPWRRGMDGCGAHESCLRPVVDDDMVDRALEAYYGQEGLAASLPRVRMGEALAAALRRAE